MNKADLRFVSKNNDNLIMFLEKGNSNAGLQHKIERHWNDKELMKYFSSQDEMVENLFSTIIEKSYLSKTVVPMNGKNNLEFTYEFILNNVLKRIFYWLLEIMDL